MKIQNGKFYLPENLNEGEKILFEKFPIKPNIQLCALELESGDVIDIIDAIEDFRSLLIEEGVDEDDLYNDEYDENFDLEDLFFAKYAISAKLKIFDREIFLKNFKSIGVKEELVDAYLSSIESFFTTMYNSITEGGLETFTIVGDETLSILNIDSLQIELEFIFDNINDNMLYKVIFNTVLKDVIKCVGDLYERVYIVYKKDNYDKKINIEGNCCHFYNKTIYPVYYFPNGYKLPKEKKKNIFSKLFKNKKKRKGD